MDQIFDPIFSSPQFILFKQLFTLFYLVFTAALIFWTWRDAKKRGAMSWFWALVVLFFNVAGWAIYMVVRPPEYLEDVRERALEIRLKEDSLKSRSGKCPACLRPVEPDFLVCPNCMKLLKKACVECGRPLELKWHVCPYCKATQGEGPPKTREKSRVAEEV
ncbi:MAG: zinc ribbon domain-containing protein [Coriobacteriia bacterium]